ncbi:MAG: ABC transporter ATP-binding protein, partial [Gemmatimonas sp.]
FALEAMALCALLALGIFLLVRKDDWASIVAILSVYAMAGYRLLPAAQLVFRSATTLRANLDVVQDITRDVTAGRGILQREPERDRHFSTSQSIALRGVTFRYPGESRDVLQRLNLRIERNAITALVGRSGAGKSTLADLLLGLINPTEGEISIDGTPIHTAPRSWQRSVALVSQSVFLIDDTVAANIAFGSPGPIDRARMERAARMANADQFIAALPGGFECGIGEAGGRLSGGQRQRVGIARALYNDADVIVLDEPTSALDSLAEREVLAAIESMRGQKTIILITHRLNSLRAVDKIVLLDGGELSAVGTFSELEQQSPTFRDLLASH